MWLVLLLSGFSCLGMHFTHFHLLVSLQSFIFKCIPASTHVVMISDVRAGALFMVLLQNHGGKKDVGGNTMMPLFIGQIADALATPIVGMLSDRASRGTAKGRKLCLALGSTQIATENW